jgi:hypothetical protein
LIKLSDSGRISDPWDELAKAIVHQAVLDWRHLISKGKIYGSNGFFPVSFNELRKFFKSDYCRLMVGTDPESILRQLEKELDESRKGEKSYEKRFRSTR